MIISIICVCSIIIWRSGLEFTNRCGWVCVGLDGQYIILYSFEHYMDTVRRYTLGEYFYDIIFYAKRKSGR